MSKSMTLASALDQAEAELRRITDERNKDISTQIVDHARNLRVVEEELKKAEERTPRER